MDTELLKQARDILENLTPLKSDCGQYCGSACCKDNGEAGSGVWLLPGEGADFAPEFLKPGRLPVAGKTVVTLYCGAACDRKKRPYLCRIFPLVPYYSEKKQAWSVRMDRRAAQICPLFSMGTKALCPAFTEGVRQSVQLLASDPEWEAVLKTLAAEEEAYHFTL